MRAKEFILTELNMAPGNLAKFANSPAVANMQAGFEAELIIPGEYEESTPGDIDLDQDVTLPHNVDLSDIAEFFNTSTRSLSDIDNEYTEYISGDKEREYIDNELDSRITYLQDKDEELEYEDAKEQAWDELSHEYYQGSDMPSWYEFLHDELSLRTYHDVYENWARLLEWPHYKQEGGFAEAAGEYVSSLEHEVGDEVIVLNDYHEVPKQLGTWYIEPDPSITPAVSGYIGIEIVSPPMPVAEMLIKFNKLMRWAKIQGAVTNKSTGFHVGVSMTGQSTANMDYVKLALFLGDQYILQRFGRELNTYAKSSALVVQQMVHRNSDEEIKTKLAALKQGMINKVSGEIYKQNSDKYMTINMRSNYIEFRGIGDDYLSHPEVVYNTILRYIRAYAVAADPQAERQEYFKKLSKLMNPTGDDKLSPFVQFAMGEIGKDDLIYTLAVRKSMKKAGLGQVSSPPSGSLARPQFTPPTVNKPPSPEEDWIV